jgi:hypothetical protein
MPSKTRAIDSTPEPEPLAAMHKALTEVCIALQVSDRRDREIVASCILELALGGVTDFKSLRDGVLMDRRVGVLRSGARYADVVVSA